MYRFMVGVAMFAAVSYGEMITTVFTPYIPDDNYQGLETYDGNNSDLRDLPHARAYEWGINYTLAANEKVTGAVLEIKDIYNWNTSPNALFIDLLNDVTVKQDPALVKWDPVLGKQINLTPADYAKLNVNRYVDADDAMSDYFNNWNGGEIALDKLVYQTNGTMKSQRNPGDVSITDGNGSALGQNVKITLNSFELAKLNDYLSNNGNFGFGIDADCHFYNSGFKFTMVTEKTNVPEPASLSLFGLGLLGLLFFRRKKQ
jgi:hypothetical protein